MWGHAMRLELDPAVGTVISGRWESETLLCIDHIDNEPCSQFRAILCCGRNVHGCALADFLGCYTNGMFRPAVGISALQA